METVILLAFTSLFYVTFGIRNPPLANQWLLVLNQDVSSGDGYFDSNIALTGIQNKDNPQSNTFSIVGGLDKNDFLHNDVYTFRLIYGGLSDGSSFDQTWTQTSWLMDSRITGSSVGQYDANEPNGFYGLGLSHRAFLDGNAGHHNTWWYAVGSITPFENGIPAVHELVAQSARLYVCTGDDCDQNAKTFECPLDDDNVVACPMPYNYPSCLPDCTDASMLPKGDAIYRMESTHQCYKPTGNIEDVDRRQIVDCDTGNPIEGFGFKVCSKETDIFAKTHNDFNIIYQEGLQRFSCDIIDQASGFNALYTCKSAVPIGDCFEDDNFVQINIMGNNDVCIDAIIYDGEMLPVVPRRLGDAVHGGPVTASLNSKMCPSIRDRNTCLTSKDDREGGFYDQPCTWCNGGRCTVGNGNKCEPQEWLLSRPIENQVEPEKWEFASDNDDGVKKVYKRRYDVENGVVSRRSLPSGYGMRELIAPECLTMRVEVTACEWHDEAVGGDLKMRISGTEGKSKYFSVNEAAELPIMGETREYFFPSSVWDGVGELNGVDLIVKDDDGYCVSNVAVDALGSSTIQTMEFDANHFGNGIFLQPQSLELQQHASRKRMLMSEGDEMPRLLRLAD